MKVVKKVTRLKPKYAKGLKVALALAIMLIAIQVRDYSVARIQTAIKLAATEDYIFNWQILYFTAIIAQAFSLVYVVYNVIFKK